MANTDQASAKTKQAVAKHDLLDSAGNPVDDEESATGMRYTLLANGESYDYQFGKSAAADRMLAIFGAKTLATNETSAVRQKNGNDPAAQISAVRERFGLIESGSWVDRTREPRTATPMDKQAMLRVLVKVGELDGTPYSDADVAMLAQKMEEDKGFVNRLRGDPRIGSMYAIEVGKSQVSAADILGLVK